MAEQKTRPTTVSVEEFLNKVEPEEKRRDCFEILEMMKKITGEKPVMWGPSIVGFGKYHYKYQSGHEGDSCLSGFSPRKQAITLYVMMARSASNYEELLKKLGKHKTSVACLYIKRLADVDKKVLEELISKSFKEAKSYYKA